jgi:cell division protein FtsB
VNVDLGIWDKLTKLVVFLLFVAGLLIVAVWYRPLIQTNERFRKEILHLDAQILKQEETSRQLRAAIEAQKHDPKAVERLARERLGYGKPGETIVRFEPPTTNSVVR